MDDQIYWLDANRNLTDEANAVQGRLWTDEGVVLIQPRESAAIQSNEGE